MKILYVEDNAVNMMLVERVAKMGGHDVVGRTIGEAALEDFDAIKPDLVLMDIQLEGKLNGLDVVRELRKRGVQLPIVALTAYAMKGDREKALAAGCDEYLPKPLPVPKLVELLKAYRPRPSAMPASAHTVTNSTAPRDKTQPVRAQTPDDLAPGAAHNADTTTQDRLSTRSSDTKMNAKPYEDSSMDSAV